MTPRALLTNQLNGGSSLLMDAAQSLRDNEFLIRLPEVGECPDWIFDQLASNLGWFISVPRDSKIQIPQEFRDVF